MQYLKADIGCDALERYSADLRDIFLPVTVEVRKSGKVLSDDEGSFYSPDRFSWKYSVRLFFNAYHRLCERKQLMPVYQESTLSSTRKVPYASLDTIRVLHRGLGLRLDQFREARIPLFRDIPSNPTISDLDNARNSTEDPDIRQFLGQIVLIDRELREYAAQLDSLVSGWRRRDEDVRAAAPMKEVLEPYIRRLKSSGAVSATWSYPYPNLEAKRRKEWLEAQEKARLARERAAAIERERVAREREKERAAAERERLAREKVVAAARERTARGKALAEEPVWSRFDRAVTRFGRRIEDNMSDITDKVVFGFIVFACIIFAGTVIVAWVDEGFFGAFLYALLFGGFIAFLVGWLGTLLYALGKLIASVPFFLLRWICYRGWTLVLTLVLLSGAGIFWLFSRQLLYL